MNRRGAGGLTVLVLTIALFASARAYAVDGVVLIDQNKALAGNVTPGDTAGFPVTISQPGSYRLSSNLTVPNATTSAIQITSHGVSLDLNGFSIIGPGTFPSEIGIVGDGHKRVRIFNGAISGFSQAISFQGASELITLERLQIDAFTISAQGPVAGGVAVIGRDVSAKSLIRDVIGKGQIQITCPSVVVDTVGSFGVVEMNVPFNGSGVSFPTNCKGENVVTFAP